MANDAVPRFPYLPLAFALSAVTGIGALAVVGWARHGEAIFLKLADGAWMTCF